MLRSAAGVSWVGSCSRKGTLIAAATLAPLEVAANMNCVSAFKQLLQEVVAHVRTCLMRIAEPVKFGGQHLTEWMNG